jgi:hypothetical protein
MSGPHQLLGQLAQHLGTLAVARLGRVADGADRVVHPAQRNVAVGEILAPRTDLEPILVIRRARAN